MTSPGYGCQYCDGAHPVNWLITHLNPAVTISVCDEDFPVALIPVIGGELGVDGGELYGVVEAFVNGQAAAEAAEDPPPADPDPAPPAEAADKGPTPVRPAASPRRTPGGTSRPARPPRSAAKK